MKLASDKALRAFSVPIWKARGSDKGQQRRLHREDHHRGCLPGITAKCGGLAGKLRDLINVTRRRWDVSPVTMRVYIDQYQEALPRFESISAVRFALRVSVMPGHQGQLA